MQATTKFNKDGSICRIIEASNGDFAVDLFPYKIKNRELFYNRNHPINISPNSFEYQIYWTEQLKNYTEGRWVNDEGTWVFMPPKLDFYINYVKIVDENRKEIQPRLRDNEWIMSYYYLCCEGFSGFEEDENYTCLEIIKKIEQGETIFKYEKEILEKSKHVKKQDGTYKKYINAWEYLTEHYLITHKASKPLGKAIYENLKKDAMILAARACAKSFYGFGGQFLHEWCTNGVKSVEEFKQSGNSQKLFAATAVRKDQLDKSLAIIKRFYENQPGQYVFGINDEGKEDKAPGVLYKSIIGSWESGSKIEHKVTNINNKIEITGNICQTPIITPDNYTLLAGDRVSIILIEEVGFLSYPKKVRSAFRDSLKVGEKKVGIAIYLGTGGNMETIQESKDMFENPVGYDIYPIPNYFDKNRGGFIGLFLSSCLKSEEYKDSNGNTLYEEALLNVIMQREKEMENSDLTSFWDFIAFNPLYPKEMLRPSSKSVLPAVEMTEHRANLILKDIWKSRSSVGSFVWDFSEHSKVSFKRDLTGDLTPINQWGKDRELHNRDGAWVMYESVMPNRPDNLYYILYDPAAQSGEGTSLHSALVYKHKFKGGDKSLQETFVAEFIGRKDTLEKNYEEVIKAALFYNAKILPERNIPGFVEWCERRGYSNLIINEPLKVMQEVRRTTVRPTYRKGLRTDDAINRWSLARLGDWLRDPIQVDEDGTPLKIRYQNIYSLRLLDEAINFDYSRKTEFDHMSSALLLMPLLLEIEDDVVEILDETEELLRNKYSKQSSVTYAQKQRPVFLQY